MTPVGIAAFSNMTALSPTGESRPFDRRRNGFVIGEGGAALVIESLERARARGAHIYAEIIGASSNADAHHITARRRVGRGRRFASSWPRGCRDRALRRRARQRHGTSTILNDLAEAEAIHKVFGAGRPPVTSIKGITGHSLAAAGALEAVAAVMTIERG